MKKIEYKKNTLSIGISNNLISKFTNLFAKYDYAILIFILTIISIFSFLIYWENGLGLAYNDARSHLDIGRRVVEGLKPGLAQLGSVWLPLPHLLMVPTIWNDFMWHSGLSGALISMVSFVATGFIIYMFLKNLGINALGRIMGVFVFVANINVLYLQSTAMTELLLLSTMTAGVYELFMWQKENKMIHLIYSAFWIMLATLNRYDGWFLFFWAAMTIILLVFRKKGYKAAEGTFLFFCTLGGVGIIMWFLWNLVIFKDPLYFAFGPYSAHAQQLQLEDAGVLASKKDLLLSIKIYFYALMFNQYGLPFILSIIGAVMLFIDRKITTPVKIAISSLFAPLVFNIIALFFGFSVLFVQGISGDTWFNVRYGIMMAPSIAIFVGYLIGKTKTLRYLFIGLILMVSLFAFVNNDAVTIDDARVGSSQKNVTEVSGWLSENTREKDGFIMISAASHDAIIFSSGLPMKKFIHEGTGDYWLAASSTPDRWARWIIMRTNDMNDGTFKAVSQTDALPKYNLVGKYPFADIYELKPEYLKTLNTKAILIQHK